MTAKNGYDGTTAKLTATACTMALPVVHASSDCHATRTKQDGQTAHDRLHIRSMATAEAIRTPRRLSSARNAATGEIGRATLLLKR